MRFYKADLHIHTLLSPCGNLEMSPVNIIAKAKEKQLDIIGITDHNSTKHCQLTRRIGEREGITVFCGAEVTTKEEVHCLTFFENDDSLDGLQSFLDKNLPHILNNSSLFGEQVVIDENENIIEEVEFHLSNALFADITQVKEMVRTLKGVFIPAHIDRQRHGLISQLGFIPSDLHADALEITRFGSVEDLRNKYRISQEYSFIRSSDAHFLNDIGRAFCHLYIEEPTFAEFRMALAGENGRFVEIV